MEHMTSMIKFPNRDEEFKGFYELSIACQTVKVTPGALYVVTAEQGKLLTSRGINYKTIRSW